MAQNAKKKTKTTNKELLTAEEQKIRGDIKILIVLGISVLLFLSNLGLCGVIGKFLASLQFGLFGLLAYAFPVILFLGYAFLVSNKGNKVAVQKFIGFLGLYLFACGFFHVLQIGYEKQAAFLDFFKDSVYDRSGGGLVGGSLVKIFGTAFSTVGAYILLVLGLVIFAIILTQKPLVTKAREQSSKAVNTAREKHRYNAERRAERAEERTRAFELREKSSREPEYEQLKLQFDDEVTEKTTQWRAAESASVSDRGRKEFIKAAADLPEEKPEEISLPKVQLYEPPVEAALEEPQWEGLEEFRQEPLPVLKPAAQSVAIPSFLRQEPPGGKKVKSAFPEEEMPSEFSDEDAPIELTAQQDVQVPERIRVKGTPGLGNTQELLVSEIVSAADGKASAASGKSSAYPVRKKKNYRLPPLSLLNKSGKSAGESREYLNDIARRLQQTLLDFGVKAAVTHVSCGPTVTRFELKPAPGVKVARIVNLADDIQLNLAAKDLRIDAPIAGKDAVGIEIPNQSVASVGLRSILESAEFRQSKGKLSAALGLDVAGKPVVADLARMPHVLIAGATGSGKSVCLNTIIVSILYKARPDEVKFIMVDPKKVELSIYEGIPHLVIPVVKEAKKAAGALNWAVQEMTRRYDVFAEYRVKNLEGYNERIDRMTDVPPEDRPERLPQIVIVVDELADLMMVAPGEVEDAICRLAQLARAAGIHLVIATQRPSVNVITGLIKANMPSRIALAVASGVDSRTILDTVGAEKLLGKGDMLYFPQDYKQPARVQGAYVSEEEIAGLVDFFKKSGEAEYDANAEAAIASMSSGGSAGGGAIQDEIDPYFADAGRFLIEKDKASIGMLQRAFKIGFNRAARIMDQLCDAGCVGEEEGTKPRKILMSPEQFEQYLEEH